MPELLNEAKKLGINSEGLSYNQLRSAIKNKKEEIESKTTEGTKSTDGNATKDGVKSTGPKGSDPIMKPEEKLDNNEDGDSSKKTETAETSNNPTVLKHQNLKAQRAKNAKEAAKVAKTQKAKAEEAKSLAEKKKTAGKKDKRPVFTDDRGLRFRFKKTAPKTLNIDGRSVPVSEIIKEKEIMLELIYGNSNFVEQIYS